MGEDETWEAEHQAQHELVPGGTPSGLAASELLDHLGAFHPVLCAMLLAQANGVSPGEANWAQIEELAHSDEGLAKLDELSHAEVLRAHEREHVAAEDGWVLARQPFLDAPGYVAFGEREGTPVVLLPGVPENHPAMIRVRIFPAAS